jgi:hypothetical protein
MWKISIAEIVKIYVASRQLPASPRRSQHRKPLVSATPQPILARRARLERFFPCSGSRIDLRYEKPNPIATKA